MPSAPSSNDTSATGVSATNTSATDTSTTDTFVPPAISRALLLLMAIAVAATAANLYYNQPLLAEMAASLGLSQGMVGLVPSATQFGYAAAILLISPLGDTMDRRVLIRNLSITLSLASLAIFLAPSLWPLLMASFVVGLGANITQQLIPLAASLSTPETRGKVIGTLMTGLTIGILLSRTLSGTIGEYWGWRSVFLVAALIAVIIGVLLHRHLPSQKPSVSMAYPQLIASMFTLVKRHPLLRESALTGALWFAAFNAMWATLAIHVSDAPFDYSIQQAGLFGIIGLAGIFGAKASGRLVNRVGAGRLITVALLMVLAAFAVLAIWGDSLAGLIVGIILLDLGVFGAQIPNQVRVFSIDPKAQSRMNAVYMLGYYLGAGAGSAIGVKVMSLYDWEGLSLFGLSLAAAALLHHCLTQRRAF
ncbi:MFS transporter [Cobetia sp. L2A1]|uniref:MFS transporter n=1 Tax=Cobetia sp. L2A1 TaxID=2686360 RepID=UPI00131D9AA1|nr:MFS transporter [Cobetia sp. L2A1]